MLAWQQSGRKGPRPSRAPRRLPAWYHWWKLYRLATVKGKGSWAWRTYLKPLHAQQRDADARLTAARTALTNWAKWGATHQAEIHYTQGQARDYYLHEPKARLPLWTDCSGFVTYCYWAAGLPDPSGLAYNYVGFTGTLLENAQNHGHILFDVSLAQPGDPIVIGPGTGWHAVIVIEAGKDPLVVSHGSEAGPRVERLSLDTRQPKRVCQTLN